MHTIVEFGEDMRLLWIPKMLILVLGCEDFVLTNLEVSNGANLPRQETDRNGISQYSSRFTALFLAFDHSTQEICFQGSLAMRYLLNGSTWKRRAKRPFPALDTCCEAPRVPMTVDACAQSGGQMDSQRLPWEEQD